MPYVYVPCVYIFNYTDARPAVLLSPAITGLLRDPGFFAGLTDALVIG